MADDVRMAWKQAGDQLSGLGLKLKHHYEEQRGADGEQVRAQDEVKEAVRKLGAAVQDAVDAMGAAARDQSVKEDVRQVGRTLKDALGVTFSEISDELGKAFDRGPTGSWGSSDPSAPAAGSPSDSPYDSPEYGTPPAGSTPPADPTPPPTPSPAARDREPGDPTP